MPKLEFFFDYSCPYCLKGYNLLLELLPDFPGLEVEWFPCEAHPRPETYGKHSDLCARGMYIARELGVDVMAYHPILFQTALDGRSNIEDPIVIAEAVSSLIPGNALLDALQKGKYQLELEENNRLCWEEYDFPAVPSMRLDGRLLPAIPGVGLTKDGMRAFLENK